jgi:hypothetical protein
MQIMMQKYCDYGAHAMVQRSRRWLLGASIIGQNSWSLGNNNFRLYKVAIIHCTL